MWVYLALASMAPFLTGSSMYDPTGPSMHAPTGPLNPTSPSTCHPTCLLSPTHSLTCNPTDLLNPTCSSTPNHSGLSKPTCPSTHKPGGPSNPTCSLTCNHSSLSNPTCPLTHSPGPLNPAHPLMHDPSDQLNPTHPYNYQKNSSLLLVYPTDFIPWENSIKSCDFRGTMSEKCHMRGNTVGVFNWKWKCFGYQWKSFSQKHVRYIQCSGTTWRKKSKRSHDIIKKKKQENRKTRPAPKPTMWESFARGLDWGRWQKSESEVLTRE